MATPTHTDQYGPLDDDGRSLVDHVQTDAGKIYETKWSNEYCCVFPLYLLLIPLL